MKFTDRRYTPRAKAEPVRFRWRLYSQDERGFFILKKYLTTRNISRISIMGALGAVLMLFDFPIAIAPTFYKIDLGDLPCLIGAFAMGPVPAFFIQIVKIVVKLLLKPTSTAFVGEIAAFICSSAFTVSAAYFYFKDRSKSNAIKSMAIASVILAVVATVANYVFIIPAYVKLFNMPLETIIDMGNSIFPIVKDKLSFVLCCVLPFNIIKAVIVDVLTFFLYRHIAPLLRRI